MGQRYGDGWEIVSRDEFDLVADRLCLLFRLDEDMSARGTPFRHLRVQRYTQRF